MCTELVARAHVCRLTAACLVATALLGCPGGGDDPAPTPAPPASPQFTNAWAGDGAVELFWTPVPGAMSYMICFATQHGVSRANAPSLPGGRCVGVQASTSPMTWVNGLTNDVTWHFVVLAEGPGGTSAESTELDLTPRPRPPPPTGVAAAARVQSVSLSWNPVQGAHSYTVYFASSPGVTPSSYASLPGGGMQSCEASPCLVAQLAAGTAWYFVITATNPSGPSDPSVEVSATPEAPPPPPRAPKGLAAKAGNGTVTLSWSPVEGATSYNVYRAEAAGLRKDAYAHLPGGAAASGVTPPLVVDGLSNWKRYWFVVTAVGDTGESAESLQIAVAPHPPPTWTWLRPRPQGNDLFAVRALDSSTAWAVGGGGTILHTADGGTTWTPRPSGTLAALSAIDFVSATEGWAVGEFGTVLHTVDGGASWTARASGVESALSGVDFVDASTGWIAAAEFGILVTTDGGASWTRQPPSGFVDLSVSGVVFTSATMGFASGWTNGTEGVVLSTDDAGATWTPHLEPDADGVYGIDARGASAWGAYSGSDPFYHGGVVRSGDGGATWTSVSVISGSAIVGVALATDTIGYAVGNRGEILRSADGGRTWEALTSGTTHGLSAVSFSDESRGWAVGSDGTILRTTDGGTTWTQQTVRLSPDRGLMTVAFVSATEGWAAGGGGTILHTTDGGAGWELQTSGKTREIRALHFRSALDGWAVGETRMILHTTDGGATWADKSASYPQNYDDVDFTSSTNGWVLAEEYLLHTTDAGATWSARLARDFGLTGMLGGFDFVDESTGFCVGANGQVYATTDGGLTWTPRTSGETVNLRKVRFANATTGWILGDGGIVLRTTDGGATWTRRLQSALSLTTLTAVDADHAIVGGGGGAVLVTRDGGASWVRQNTGSVQDVWGIAFPTSAIGFLVGEGILTTATGGF